jgi:hypothetical protein
MKKQLSIILGIVIILAGCATLKSRQSSTERFHIFQQNFSAVTLPFEIDGNHNPKSASGNYLQSIYGFKEFIPELTQSSFGRSVSSNCKYMASVCQTERYVALCYLVQNSIADTLPANDYIMATYDIKTGKHIDVLNFAGRPSPENFTTGVIGIDNKITISAFKNTWKNDPKENGYKGNTIIKTEKLGETCYRLDEKGHFKKMALVGKNNLGASR